LGCLERLLSQQDVAVDCLGRLTTCLARGGRRVVPNLTEMP
jgi:hypothetical protein